MGSGRLEGMVALVTGAGGGADGGIGVGVARCLAREGARVAVNDLKLESSALTVEQLRAMGAQAWSVVGDVSDPDQAAALVKGTVEQFGQLDILVNNAGIEGPNMPVERLPVEDWLRVMAVNVHGPFYTCRAAVPLMRARGFGRIINICSATSIHVGARAGADYTTSKSALLGLTHHLAAQVTRYGITANAILPGLILTPLMKSHYAPETLDESIATISRKVAAMRVGTPDDVGWTAVFLASREAGFISGMEARVDGAQEILLGDFSNFRKTSSARDLGA